MGDSEQSWAWPDSLDALIAASQNHRLLFENEEVRVLDTRIGPGETVPVHTHRWPGVLYVVSSADFVRRDGDRNVLLDTRTAGSSWNPIPRCGRIRCHLTHWRTWVAPRSGFSPSR